MSPRRLVPLAAICLALWALWWGVSWWQGKKEAEKVAAAKVFQVQEAQIGSVTLKRGAEEVRLRREGQDDGVHLRVLEKVGSVVVNARDAELRRHGLGPLGNEIGHGHGFGEGEFGGSLDVFGSHDAATDDADTYFVHRASLSDRR